mmetsp:Transcript_60352/g.106070  ORF Transcript_60352/g.106070 Transcript_60352/m.106070 type:complete len:394 (-) Transcript_60352:70-1251(-)|eukprot:CAMPEP_0184974734 /NCGR_PEP_ID=MMETSP1098-20130426/6137_1 /TAXON_ID=89044 /ORGANISM="Spumella elongata, Strain CCAP 955/1" /LENGTH=393 /DNA_ID=CAMNT_0027497355 /DNA_START=45 /DNA_END=1226 /DNA_ORIENTATION=+
MFSSSIWSTKRKVNETPHSQSKRGRLILFNRNRAEPTTSNEEQRKPIQDGMQQESQAPGSVAEYLRLLIQNGISFNIRPKTPTIGRSEVVSTGEKVRADAIAVETKKLEQFALKEAEEKALLDRIKAEMANKENEPKPVQIGEEMDVDEDQEAELIAARKAAIDSQEAATVKQILSGRSSNDIVIDKFNIDITVSKISCLKPGTWLNDEVVNFYMCMLQERDQKLCEASNGQRMPSHYFNSFFISKLLENRQYTYSNVKRWSKKFDVFAMDKIFMPVNLNNSHWVMAVVFVQKKEIHYYDSMSGNGEFYMKSILRWLGDEANDKKIGSVNPSEWTLTDEDPVPQQRNGYDCGVFSILCADYISDNLPLRYSQEEMPDNRVKIGAAIKRGKLTY